MGPRSRISCSIFWRSLIKGCRTGVLLLHDARCGGRCGDKFFQVVRNTRNGLIEGGIAGLLPAGGQKTRDAAFNQAVSRISDDLKKLVAAPSTAPGVVQK